MANLWIRWWNTTICELMLKVHSLVDMLFFFGSVIKQALKASGANCTQKHMEEVSMCGLFLLEAAKKADQEFLIPSTSSHHTIRSSEEDIKKMTKHLMEEKVPQEVVDRSVQIEFEEPIELGMKKIVEGWLRNYLQSSGPEYFDDQDTETGTPTQDDDPFTELNYELHATSF